MKLDAVILAGGLGTRLRTAVPELPKCLAPVAGRAFIDILLDELQRQGLRHVVLAVGYRNEQVRAHLGASYGALSIDYSIEREPLGTGGAARLALGACHTDHVLLLNGDTWQDIDLAAMLAAHRGIGVELTMAVREVDDVGRYGAVHLSGGRVSGFSEKGAAGGGWINAGVYIVARNVFERVELPAAFSLEHDFLRARLEQLRPLAFGVRGRFIDIGIPEDLARAQFLFATPSQDRQNA